MLAAMDEEGLTPEERKFVEFYDQHHDPHKALRQAYGTDHHRSLQKLINKPEVMAAIKRRQDYASQRFNLSKEWVIQQLMYKSGARKRDLYDEQGNVLPVNEWPDYLDAAISSIDFEDLYEKDDGGKRQKVGKTLKVRFYNTNESDALLLRYLGVDHGSSSSGRDRLKEILSVCQAGPVPRAIEGEVVEKK